jgi:putative membrane protein insertion efficiency factor
VCPEMRKFALGSIRMYRRFISPMLPPSCRYWPSCSEYASQAIQRARRFEGRTIGSVADNALQPLVQGRDRPGKMRRIA